MLQWRDIARAAW